LTARPLVPIQFIDCRPTEPIQTFGLAVLFMPFPHLRRLARRIERAALSYAIQRDAPRLCRFAQKWAPQSEWIYKGGSMSSPAGMAILSLIHMAIVDLVYRLDAEEVGGVAGI
jgi:hypothetical protein